MIIDIHTHGFYGKYFEQLSAIGGDWAKKVIANEVEQGQKKPYYLDAALRVEMLDQYGIDYQVVTPGNYPDVNLHPGEAKSKMAFARALNDNLARFMEDSKGRLITVGAIPLECFEQGGYQEIERAIKGLGLKGMSVNSNIHGKPLDSPEFESFWAQAATMDIPVFIHPQNPAGHGGRPYEIEYDLTHNFGWPFETTLALARLVFSGIMERFPNLKVVSHHLGGGMIPFFWGRIMETYEPSKQLKRLGRVIPKPLFEYFSRFFYDTAVGGNVSAIKCAYDIFGADTIVFATDFPYGPDGGKSRLATYPDVIRSLGLPAPETEKIFAGNARKILKLK